MIDSQKYKDEKSVCYVIIGILVFSYIENSETSNKCTDRVERECVVAQSCMNTQLRLRTYRKEISLAKKRKRGRKK